MGGSKQDLLRATEGIPDSQTSKTGVFSLEVSYLGILWDLSNKAGSRHGWWESTGCRVGGACEGWWEKEDGRSPGQHSNSFIPSLPTITQKVPQWCLGWQEGVGVYKILVAVGFAPTVPLFNSSNFFWIFKFIFKMNVLWNIIIDSWKKWKNKQLFIILPH